MPLRRSEGISELRRRVHDLCTRLLRARGAPAMPLAFETLVWLNEVASTEEASVAARAKGGTNGIVPAGNLSSEPQMQPDKFERLAATTVHRYSTCGTAWAVLGLTLARRCIRRSKGDPASEWAGDGAKAGPALATLMLEHGCTGEGGGSAAACVALTRLRLRAGDWEAALTAVAGGMAWVRRFRLCALE